MIFSDHNTYFLDLRRQRSASRRLIQKGKRSIQLGKSFTDLFSLTSSLHNFQLPKGVHFLPVDTTSSTFPNRARPTRGKILDKQWLECTISLIDRRLNAAGSARRERISHHSLSFYCVTLQHVLVLE